MKADELLHAVKETYMISEILRRNARAYIVEFWNQVCYQEYNSKNDRYLVDGSGTQGWRM